MKVLAILCLVAGVWAYEYLEHYDPLDPGTGRYGASARSDVKVSATAGTTYVLRHAEGDTFVLSVPVTNDGRWPVTLENIRLGPQRGPLFFTDVFLDPDYQREYEPFEPTRLEPGESLQLGLRAEYGSCTFTAGDSAYFTSLPMDYSLFGLTRQTELEFGSTLVVRGYQGRVCADPDDPKLRVSI